MHGAMKVFMLIEKIHNNLWTSLTNLYDNCTYIFKCLWLNGFDLYFEIEVWIDSHKGYFDFFVDNNIPCFPCPSSSRNPCQKFPYLNYDSLIECVSLLIWKSFECFILVPLLLCVLSEMDSNKQMIVILTTFYCNSIINEG